MNYEKLIKDKNLGLISDDMIIVIDNDCGYWACQNSAIPDEEQDRLCKEYTKDYGKPGGPEDIVKILQAIGLNAEWC